MLRRRVESTRSKRTVIRIGNDGISANGLTGIHEKPNNSLTYLCPVYNELLQPVGVLGRQTDGAIYCD